MRNELAAAAAGFVAAWFGRDLWSHVDTALALLGLG